MTLRDFLFTLLGILIGATVAVFRMTPLPKKPFLKVWRNGGKGFQFLGWHGEEPTDPQIKRKRVLPRKRKKTKTNPDYEAACKRWIKGEGLTPAQAWPKFAEAHGFDPNDTGLKENFLRAMYRYLKDEPLWSRIRDTFLKRNVSRKF